ncbi:MAG TPA: hypothetical protein VE980_24870 [Pyrinomonadaceae bacterium]|nr:hypothetical protein [Pyrinomonadaceae bacterium]
MWRCSNCGNGVEDKYAHCWQCGTSKAVKRTTQTAEASQKAVPEFASYEELAHVPARPMWIMRRGPLQRIVLLVGILTVFKILSSRLFGAYGVYMVAGVAVIALVLILWGFFHRDPNEGVGVKLN